MFLTQPISTFILMNQPLFFLSYTNLFPITISSKLGCLPKFYIDLILVDLNERPMFRNYSVPKRLRTIQFPGQEIELWLNEKKVSKIEDVSPKERSFIRDFVYNLEELGWKVLKQL